MPANPSNVVRVAWICAAALAVFVVWIPTEVSANAGLGFFYAVPVGLAAWWGGGRWAAAAVVGCCLLYVLGTLIQPVPNFELAFPVRLTVFAGVAVVVSLARKRLVDLEHSEEELEAIRAALTPPILPQITGVDFAAAFVPSELGVSGDFYMLTNGPNDAAIVIVGDVVGHGPRAAQLATFVRTQFAACAANTSDPAELLSFANRAILESPRKDAFVSAACLRYSPDTSKLAWAIAGHPLPLRLPGLEALSSTGKTMLLGVEADLKLSTSEASFDAEGGVLVFTDGATDVRGADGEMLGLDGLLAFLRPLAHLPARELIAEAEKTIVNWAGAQIKDDVCIVALRPAATPN